MAAICSVEKPLILTKFRAANWLVSKLDTSWVLNPASCTLLRAAISTDSMVVIFAALIELRATARRPLILIELNASSCVVERLLACVVLKPAMATELRAPI